MPYKLAVIGNKGPLYDPKIEAISISIAHFFCELERKGVIGAADRIGQFTLHYFGADKSIDFRVMHEANRKEWWEADPAFIFDDWIELDDWINDN